MISSLSDEEKGYLIWMDGAKPMSVSMESTYRFKAKEAYVDVHNSRPNWARLTRESQ